MKYKTRQLSFLVLILILFLLWATRHGWLHYFAQNILFIKNNSEFIQALDSLINILTLPVNFLLAYLAWISGKSEKEGREIDRQPPLVKVTVDQLLSRFGLYGSKVPWVDRGASSVSHLRERGRIVILGQLGIGKTREAVELIIRAISNELISENRIFQPSASFRSYDSLLLRHSLEQMIDPQEPILLFVDDFPRYYFKNSLTLIEEAVKVLEGCKDFYLIITAREDEISDEHLRWFQRHKFTPIKLQRLSKKQISTFLEKISSAFNLSIDRDAKEILIERSNGFPEHILIGIRRLLIEKKSNIDRDLALEMTYHSMVDLWLSAKKYIEQKRPAAVYVLRSLSVFNSALVTPHPSMVLDYAAHLWKSTGNDKWLLTKNKRLKDAIVFLRNFDFSVIAGQFLFPDIALGSVDTYDAARKLLSDFLINHKSTLRKSILRKFYNNSREHAYSLLDIAFASQTIGNLEEAIRFYNAVLDLLPIPWIFVNRGSAYGELRKFDNAIDDFNKAERLYKNYPSPDIVYHMVFIYHNRSLTYIEKGDLTRASAEIETGLSKYPNQYILFLNRGIVAAEQDRKKEAIDYLTTAINNLHDGINKAFAYFNRGRVYEKIGEITEAINDCDKAIILMPDDRRKVSLFRERGNLLSHIGQYEKALNDYSAAINLDANSIYAYLSRAGAYKELKRYEEALADFNFVTEHDPFNSIAHISKADIFTELGDIKEAISELNTAIQLADSNELKAVVLAHRGIINAKNGNLESAIADLTNALSHNPKYSYAYYQRATVYEQRRDFEKVISDCTLALEIDTNDENRAQLINMRGSALDESGKFEQAIHDYQSAIDIDKKYAPAYMNYGITLLKLHDLEKAASLLSKAISYNPELWEAYVNRGNVYVQIGEFRKAINDLTRALKHLTDRNKIAGALQNRGNAYMLQDSIKKAIKDYSGAIEIHDDGTEKGYCYYRRALCYSRLGKNNLALDDLNASIILDPTSSMAYFLRGNILANMEQTDQALSDSEQAIIYASNDSEKIQAYKFRGTLYSKRNQYKLGIIDFSNAIALDPSNYIHHYNRGLTYLFAGKLTDALQDFEHALDLNPKYAEAYNNRGATYLKLGEFEKAIDDFDQSITYCENTIEKASPYRNKAIALLSLDRQEEAMEAFRIGEGIAPKDERTVAAKVQIEYMLGNYERVIELINEAEKLSPAPAQFGFWKALALFRLDSPKNALQLLQDHFGFTPLPVNFPIIKSELEELDKDFPNNDDIKTAMHMANDYINNHAILDGVT